MPPAGLAIGDRNTKPGGDIKPEHETGGVVFFAFGVPGTWDIPLAAGWGEARFKSKPSPIVCAAGHGVSEACPNVGASYYFLDQK